MARRRIRSLPAFLALSVFVSACAGGAGAVTTVAPSTTAAPTTTTSTSTTSTSTTSTTSTTTTVPATTTTTLPEDIGATVRIPEGDGPFPAVVLVHGGGWIVGDTSIMAPLARQLTDEGYLTVNAPYQLAGEEPGFPGAIDDIACAVRYAAAHPASDGTVALIGHSAGAHISAVVALTGDEYADDCPVSGEGVPDRFVGLAGPYDVTRLGIVMLPFFGAGPLAEPEAWAAGNPQALTDENPDLLSLIMYGDSDPIVEDDYSINFHAALIESGSDSTLEVVEGARHNNMRQPEWVADLIVTWMER